MGGRRRGDGVYSRHSWKLPMNLTGCPNRVPCSDWIVPVDDIVTVTGPSSSPSWSILQRAGQDFEHNDTNTYNYGAGWGVWGWAVACLWRWGDAGPMKRSR